MLIRSRSHGDLRRLEAETLGKRTGWQKSARSHGDLRRLEAET